MWWQSVAGEIGLEKDAEDDDDNDDGKGMQGKVSKRQIPLLRTNKRDVQTNEGETPTRQTRLTKRFCA